MSDVVYVKDRHGIKKNYRKVKCLVINRSFIEIYRNKSFTFPIACYTLRGTIVLAPSLALFSLKNLIIVNIVI